MKRQKQDRARKLNKIMIDKCKYKNEGYDHEVLNWNAKTIDSSSEINYVFIND